MCFAAGLAFSSPVGSMSGPVWWYLVQVSAVCIQPTPISFFRFHLLLVTALFSSKGRHWRYCLASGSECLDLAKSGQTFINTCLRRILQIHWPDKISNADLWMKTEQLPAEDEIGRRKWGWIGHTLRRPAPSTTRQALTWNPQGKRKRGRPRNTWRRDLQADTKRMGLTWNQLETKAKDRGVWRSLVDGLYPRRGGRQK